MKQVRTHTGGGTQEMREDTVRRGDAISPGQGTKYLI